MCKPFVSADMSFGLEKSESPFSVIQKIIMRDKLHSRKSTNSNG